MKLHPIALAACAVVALAACGGGNTDDAVLVGKDGQVRAEAVSQSPTTRILSFSFGPQSHDAKLIVGPAPGQVTVFGVSGVPDGTIYTNVAGIDWRSGAGDDRLVFEVTQAADFDITVDTAAGNAEIDVKWIVPSTSTAPITPSFALATGPGTKKIQVQLESFGREVDFGLLTNLGAGNAEFKGELQYKQGSVRANGRMALNFGAGFTKAELLVDSEAQHLDLDLAPRFMTELSTKVLSDDPSSTARVRFAPTGVAGGTKIGFEMLSAAPQITLNHAVTGGAGMDEVLLGLTTIGSGVVTSTANIALGQSNDKLELQYKGLPQTTFNLSGAVALEGGDDEALLLREGIANGAPRLDCGDGIDKAIGWPSSVACELN